MKEWFWEMGFHTHNVIGICLLNEFRLCVPHERTLALLAAHGATVEVAREYRVRQLGDAIFADAFTHHVEVRVALVVAVASGRAAGFLHRGRRSVRSAGLFGGVRCGCSGTFTSSRSGGGTHGFTRAFRRGDLGVDVIGERLRRRSFLAHWSAQLVCVVASRGSCCESGAGATSVVTWRSWFSESSQHVEQRERAPRQKVTST